MPARRGRGRKAAAAEPAGEAEKQTSTRNAKKDSHPLDLLSSSKILPTFVKHSEAPELFLEPSAELSDQAKSTMKLLFDFCAY